MILIFLIRFLHRKTKKKLIMTTKSMKMVNRGLKIPLLIERHQPRIDKVIITIWCTSLVISVDVCSVSVKMKTRLISAGTNAKRFTQSIIKLDPLLTSSHLRKLLPCTKPERQRFVKVAPLGSQRMIGHSIQCVRIVIKMTVLYSCRTNSDLQWM